MVDLGKIADFGLKLAQFEAIFDSAAKLHAALVFLLTTGFRGAVAFFVGLSHFDSPKASTGVSR
ncbi:DoxX family membrane protein [Pseudomonas sp. IT-347P]